MEELRPEDLEELLQELEEEDGADESLPQEVEDLLHVLQSDSLYLARQDAADKLGKVEASSLRIVRALIAAYESDPYSMVSWTAAKSLRAPVHQGYLQQHLDLMEVTERALQQPPGSDASAGGAVKAVSPTETHAKMQKELRAWGLCLLGIGVLSLVLSGLSEPWGAVLLIVGLASFLFREAPMFAVYGTTIAWAALSNILSGQAGWIAFAGLQLVIAFMVFRKYTRYRRAETALDSPPGLERASRAFPPIGCALGALALVGLVIIFVAGVFVSLAGTTAAEGLLVWLDGLVTGLAVLGLAVAMASLLAGYGHKPIASLGLAASGLVLLVQIAFILAQMLGRGVQTEAPAARYESAPPTSVLPIPQGMRQLAPGWTSHMTDAELADNLPPGMVLAGGFWTGIAVASDGALWFSTLGGGVYRFDGQTWTTFSEDEGLASNIVLSVTEGRGPLGGTGGMLWFATAEGICRFDGETWTSYPDSAHLASGPGPTALAPDGTLWYGTAKGATRFDGENWTTFTAADGLAANYVLDIVVAPDGALWFGTNRGVTRFDGDTWSSYTTADGLAQNRVASIAVAPDGSLWFGTEGGVSRFDGKTWTSYTTADGLVNNAVDAVAVAPDGVLWFGTEGGVSRFDGETWTSYTSADVLVNETVSTIEVAPDGAVWFGTEGGLLRYVPPGPDPGD